MSVDAHGVWDYLAGALVCEEAGCPVVDALGRELAVLDHAARRTPVAAATPELLDTLLARRREIGLPGAAGARTWVADYVRHGYGLSPPPCLRGEDSFLPLLLGVEVPMPTLPLTAE